MTTEAPVQDPLHTVDVVARRLNVSDKTVRRWLKEGHLAYELVGPTKRIRIRESSIRKMLEIQQ